MKFLRKTQAIILAMAMCFTSIYAPFVSAEAITAVEGSYSGVCGDNLTWEISTYGELSIRGAGEMYDYSEEEAPWLQYKDMIRFVRVYTGVYGVSSGAFQGCSNIFGINLAHTVEYIGDYAFAYCDNLTELSISDCVKSIGYRAFAQCTRLESVIIPERVETIGDEAFDGCSHLTSIEYYGSYSRWYEIISRKDGGVQNVYPEGVSLLCDGENVTMLERLNAIDNVDDMVCVLNTCQSELPFDFDLYNSLDEASQADVAQRMVDWDHFDSFKEATNSFYSFCEGNLFGTKEFYVLMHRTGYYEGEPLEMSVYLNGEELLPASITSDGIIGQDGYVVYGYDPYKEGEQVIEIAYDEYCVSVTVYVKYITPEGVYATEIYPVPSVTCNKGTYPNFTICVRYSDGSEREVGPYDETTCDGYELGNYDPEIVGEQEVIIKYGGLELIVIITVIDDIVEEESYIVEILSEDYNIIYSDSHTYGTILGDIPNIASTLDRWQEGEGNSEGLKFIGWYDENNCTYVDYSSVVTSDMHIVPYFEELPEEPIPTEEPTAPEKTLDYIGVESNKDEYYIGDNCDISVFAYYSDNTFVEVYDYEISGFDTQTPGIKTVTVEYQGKKAEFEICVVLSEDYEERILERLNSCGSVEEMSEILTSYRDLLLFNFDLYDNLSTSGAMFVAEKMLNGCFDNMEYAADVFKENCILANINFCNSVGEMLGFLDAKRDLIPFDFTLYDSLNASARMHVAANMIDRGFMTLYEAECAFNALIDTELSNSSGGGNTGGGGSGSDVTWFHVSCDTFEVEGRNVYTVGAELEIVVRACNNDGTWCDVTDYEIAGFNSSEKGLQNVTVTYGEKTLEFTILVVEENEAYVIGFQPVNDGLRCYYGQTPQIYATVHYSDDTERIIGPNDEDTYTISGFNPYSIGRQEVTITYQYLTMSLNVEVIAPGLDETEKDCYTLEVYHSEDDIMLGQYPQMRVILIDDRDVVVRELSSEEYTIIGYNPWLAGAQDISILYNGIRSHYFHVCVSEDYGDGKKVEGIDVKSNKSKYNIGEDLDLTVIAYFSDGTVQEVHETSTDGSACYVVSGFNNTATGLKNQTVQISYRGCLELINVSLNGGCDEDFMHIDCISNKNIYFIGDELDLTVNAVFANGARVRVYDYEVYGFDNTYAGLRNVEIEYLGRRMILPIYVFDANRAGLEILNWRPIYNYGEDLCFDVSLIDAETGYIAPIRCEDYQIMGYDKWSCGYQKIEVVYGNYRKAILVKVMDPTVTGSEIDDGDIITSYNSPDLQVRVNKYLYHKGENPDIDVFVAGIEMPVGTYSVDGFDTSSVGEKRISVFCDGGNVEFNVYVLPDDVEMTDVEVETEKTIYRPGEAVDVKVKAVFSDGTSAYVYGYEYYDYDATSGSSSIKVKYLNFVRTHQIYFMNDVAEENKAEIYTPCISAVAGSTYRVPVFIRNNPGFASYKIQMNYDKTRLVPVSVEKGEIAVNQLITNLSDSNFDLNDALYISVVGSGEANVNDDGALFYVTFKVLDNPNGASTSYIEPMVRELYNENRVMVPFRVERSDINIIRPMYGDADGDGNVNTADLVYMSQYVAGWSGNYDSVFEMLADVYRDGTVNTMDIVLLSRYLAEWKDIILGEAK